MSLNSAKDLEAQISEVLETECQVLLTADFEKLPSLTVRKEELIAKLEAESEHREPSFAAQLHAKANRNARLYEATLNGLQIAIERLADVQSSFGKMTTYDDQGALNTTSLDSPSVSIKA